MARMMEITFERRRVTCVARLLEEEAPVTCNLVWNALPQSGELWHAKYASNEMYCLVPPLEGPQPGLENATIMPIPGDVVYFDFPAGHLSHKTREQLGLEAVNHFVDLAFFYGRNNYLYNPALGPVPGNVYATIVENFEEMAATCQDLWRNGFGSERLTYRRLVE